MERIEITRRRKMAMAIMGCPPSSSSGLTFRSGDLSRSPWASSPSAILGASAGTRSTRAPRAGGIALLPTASRSGFRDNPRVLPWATRSLRRDKIVTRFTTSV